MKRGNLTLCMASLPLRQLRRTTAILALMLAAGPVLAQAVLPFPAPPMGGKVGPTMQESVHKWREQTRHLPEDAPNILIVMLDDAGFGQASTLPRINQRLLNARRIFDKRG